MYERSIDGNRDGIWFGGVLRKSPLGKRLKNGETVKKRFKEGKGRREKMERRGWPTSCLHGWLHLYPNIRTCIPLPLRAKSACSTQSAVAFYHLAERESVHHWVSEFICVCICVSSSIVAHTHLFVCLWINTSLLHCLIYLQTDSSLLCSPSPSFFIHAYIPSRVHHFICLGIELPCRIMGRDWSVCPCLCHLKRSPVYWKQREVIIQLHTHPYSVEST